MAQGASLVHKLHPALPEGQHGDGNICWDFTPGSQEGFLEEGACETRRKCGGSVEREESTSSRSGGGACVKHRCQRAGWVWEASMEGHVYVRWWWEVSVGLSGH